MSSSLSVEVDKVFNFLASKPFSSDVYTPFFDQLRSSLGGVFIEEYCTGAALPPLYDVEDPDVFLDVVRVIRRLAPYVYRGTVAMRGRRSEVAISTWAAYALNMRTALATTNMIAHDDEDAYLSVLTTVQRLFEVLCREPNPGETPQQAHFYGQQAQSILVRFLLDRVADAPQPARDAPQPARDAPQPARDAPQPARDAPQPARDAPQPARDAPQPARDAPQPARDAPQPARDAPQPARDAPQPARDAPQPARDAPQPARDAPQPARDAPQPARDAPQPARDAPQPASRSGGASRRTQALSYQDEMSRETEAKRRYGLRSTRARKERMEGLKEADKAKRKAEKGKAGGSSKTPRRKSRR